MNWYVYCGNNPLSRTDPTGLLSPEEAGKEKRYTEWVVAHPFGENYGTSRAPYPHAGEDDVFIADGENETDGAPVHSDYTGIVEQVQNDPRLGWVVRIRTEDGGQYNTMHYSSVSVAEGDEVEVGYLLGYGGSTGSVCEGAHEHKEIRYNSLPADVNSNDSIYRYDQYYVQPN